MAPVRARVNTGPGPASVTLWRGSISRLMLSLRQRNQRSSYQNTVRNNLAGRVRLAQDGSGAAFRALTPS
jgi:hypothetical protein